MVIVLDASNLILGRLASETASLLLGKTKIFKGRNAEGKLISFNANPEDKVYIINADKAVITGNPKKTTKRYENRMHKKTLTNPRRGPFHARQPEEIVRRAVRGMIPWKKASGKNMYSHLRVFVGVPSDELRAQAIRFEHISADKKLCQRISVGELARRISSYDQRIDQVKH